MGGVGGVGVVGVVRGCVAGEGVPGPAGRRAGTAGRWSSPRRRTWRARPRTARR